MIWEILLDIKSIIWIKIWILIVECDDENNAIFEELETVESDNNFCESDIGKLKLLNFVNWSIIKWKINKKIEKVKN